MRELTSMEAALVNGRGAGDILAITGGLGGALGVGYAWSAGATGTAVVGMGAIGTAASLGLGASGIVGWGIGGLLNEYTPIPDYLARFLDYLYR